MRIFNVTRSHPYRRCSRFGIRPRIALLNPFLLLHAFIIAWCIKRNWHCSCRLHLSNVFEIICWKYRVILSWLDTLNVFRYLEQLDVSLKFWNYPLKSQFWNLLQNFISYTISSGAMLQNCFRFNRTPFLFITLYHFNLSLILFYFVFH